MSVLSHCTSCTSCSAERTTEIQSMLGGWMARRGISVKALGAEVGKRQQNTSYTGRAPWPEARLHPSASRQPGSSGHHAPGQAVGASQLWGNSEPEAPSDGEKNKWDHLRGRDSSRDSQKSQGSVGNQLHEILTCVTTRLNLEDMTASERRQKETETKPCVIPLMWGTRGRQIHRDEKQNGGPGAEGRRDEELGCKGYKVSVGKMKRFWRWMVEMAEQQCEWA